jgi:hypothetical protein
MIPEDKILSLTHREDTPRGGGVAIDGVNDVALAEHTLRRITLKRQLDNALIEVLSQKRKFEARDIHDIRDLLTAGANPNVKDKDGNPALLLAVKARSVEAVGLLLDTAGIDVNATCGKNFPPLTYAVSYDSTKEALEVIRLLLAAPGIDVNFARGENYRPLDQAAADDRSKNVLLLLAAPGISVKPGQTGQLSSKIAQGKKHPPLARLLRIAEKSGPAAALAEGCKPAGAKTTKPSRALRAGRWLYFSLIERNNPGWLADKIRRELSRGDYCREDRICHLLEKGARVEIPMLEEAASQGRENFTRAAAACLRDFGQAAAKARENRHPEIALLLEEMRAGQDEAGVTSTAQKFAALEARGGQAALPAPGK